VGWKIWIWMMLFNWIAMPFVWFMCPETTGKSLEEIDLLFAKPEVRDSILAEGIYHHGREKDSKSEKVERIHEESDTTVQSV
jgi:hypothetical protein